MSETGTPRLKKGLAEMLKGGVIMDVTDASAGPHRRGRGRLRGDGAGARARPTSAARAASPAWPIPPSSSR